MMKGEGGGLTTQSSSKNSPAQNFLPFLSLSLIFGGIGREF
jgi:hypothetical protein